MIRHIRCSAYGSTQRQHMFYQECDLTFLQTLCSKNDLRCMVFEARWPCAGWAWIPFARLHLLIIQFEKHNDWSSMYSLHFSLLFFQRFANGFPYGFSIIVFWWWGEGAAKTPKGNKKNKQKTITTEKLCENVMEHTTLGGGGVSPDAKLHVCIYRDSRQPVGSRYSVLLKLWALSELALTR